MVKINIEKKKFLQWLITIIMFSGIGYFIIGIITMEHPRPPEYYKKNVALATILELHGLLKEPDLFNKIKDLDGNLNDSVRKQTLLELLGAKIEGDRIYVYTSGTKVVLGTVRKEYLTQDGRVILDPWGGPYIILKGGHYKSFFDIYSFGPNRKDEKGEGDDIANWKLKLP
jgi:hypothetical protein